MFGVRDSREKECVSGSHCRAQSRVASFQNSLDIVSSEFTASYVRHDGHHLADLMRHEGRRRCSDVVLDGRAKSAVMVERKTSQKSRVLAVHTQLGERPHRRSLITRGSESREIVLTDQYVAGCVHEVHVEWVPQKPTSIAIEGTAEASRR